MSQLKQGSASSQMLDVGCRQHRYKIPALHQTCPLPNAVQALLDNTTKNAVV
jgi:hypothetical protein